MAEFHDERAEKAIRRAAEGLQAYIDAWKKLAAKIEAARKVFSQFSWAFYERAGCPYGKSPEGYMMWIKTLPDEPPGEKKRRDLWKRYFF